MELRTSLKMQVFAIQHSVRFMFENACDPTGRTLRLLSCYQAVDLLRLVSRALSFDKLRWRKIGKSVPRTDSVLVWCRRCAGSLLTVGALEAIDAIIRSRRGCAVACHSSAARRRPNRPNRTQKCPVFWMADARADIVRAAWLTQGRSLTLSSKN
jgi:hypothetical protein